ncbi:hypothetical protein [Tetragenococcus halophilus]|uniref:hypothetical protein n=1 Tax=Tetragenococcus halophilus TaxID=51669 RepID=UPI00256E64A8|nr:hypothetical protein [Tetragenococcus halophilus]GMG69204.1 hypothetical protein TEHMS4_21410 [Tetragenococcus halophilus]
MEYKNAIGKAKLEGNKITVDCNDYHLEMEIKKPEFVQLHYDNECWRMDEMARMQFEIFNSYMKKDK